VRVYGLSASAIAASGAAGASGGRGRGPRPSSAAAIAAALAFALIAAGAYAWHAGLAPRFMAASVDDKLAKAPRLSIVVLPFENLSGDKEQDYFADGITDDLTTDLSHLDGSFVISRGTAFTYKGKPVDAKAIGRELGVRYLLEGSVRRLGEKVEINAQLTSTETGANVWADRFDGERSKLGELQVEFVSRLANTLGVELVRAEALRAIRERPDNPDATDLAMRGWVKIDAQFTRETSEEAVSLFNRALALDSNNVSALMGLADALARRIVYHYSDDPATDVVHSERAANRAIAAEPESSQAHMARFWSLYARHQTREAIAEAETAIGLNPNNAEAHTQARYQNIYLGHAEDGFAGVEAALRLSPHDPRVAAWRYLLCHLHTHLAHWETGHRVV
jgi:adenylate cyclase